MSGLGLAPRALRTLYSALYVPAFPFVLAYWLGRADSRARLGEYLGRGADDLPVGGDPPHPIWVHAVSVGEAAAVMPVLRGLAEDGHSFFLTTTIEDAEVAARRHGVPLQGTCLLPLDLPPLARRLRDRLAPRAFLLSETDLWPNLLLELRDARVPAYLVNGRISPGVARAWGALRPLGREALAALRLAFVQTDADAARLEAMGYPGERVHVCGNTKWELGAPPALPEDSYQLKERVMGLERRVIVAGSTHAPEEELLLDALPGCPGAPPLLVLAPRKPGRAGEVAALARTRGRRVGLWSEVAAIQGDPDPFDVLVVDGMGLLSALYEMAEVAYVGGGFSPAGGHNFLEAIWHGKAVFGGPNWKNFESDVAAFSGEGAFRRCAERAGVQELLWELLEDDEGTRARGLAGQELLDRGGRAAGRTLERLRADLEIAPSPYAAMAALT